MTTLNELAAMLDAATGPSRELDSAFARMSGWHRVDPRFTKNRKGAWIAPEDFLGTHSDGSPRCDGLRGTEMQRDTPGSSHSIDAALALVERLLPGWEWDIELNQGVFFCALLQIAVSYEDGAHCADAPTAPIAILRALVAALIAQEKTDEA